MADFVPNPFYCLLHSTYNLDEACERYSNSSNSENYQTSANSSPRARWRQSKGYKSSKAMSELSFDRDLLKEHLQVMERYLPVFLRIETSNKRRKTSPLEPKDNPYHRFVATNDENHAVVNIFSSQQTPTSNSLQYLKPMEENHNLMTFAIKCTAMIGKESQWSLMALTDLIWSKFCRAEDLLKEPAGIINYSQSIIENLLQQTVQLLELNPLPQADMEQLSEFVQVYFVTVLLVLNQYFQNPYYDERGDCEEEEDSDLQFFRRKERGGEVGSQPRKLVHYD